MVSKNVPQFFCGTFFMEQEGWRREGTSAGYGKQGFSHSLVRLSLCVAHRIKLLNSSRISEEVRYMHSGCH